jgi:hypothetical protein
MNTDAQPSKLPGLMGDFTDDQLNQHVVDNARYFTVVQINRGGFLAGDKNYTRHEVASLALARDLAAHLYSEDPKHRGILIYAVADFAGAKGFSRPVESYPVSNYMTRGDKAKLDRKRRSEARQRAKEAR